MNGFEPKLRVGFDGSGGECYESCYEIFDKGRKYDRNGKVAEHSSGISLLVIPKIFDER